MRIALCVRFNKRLFRLVWITESKNGIYLGILGGKQEAHVSYHQDGNRHAKLGDDYHNRFKDTSITDHEGPKQLGHLSFPLIQAKNGLLRRCEDRVNCRALVGALVPFRFWTFCTEAV
jgi:hypothetical protein